MMKPPFDGLRVLDLSRLLPGGLCTSILSDFGADIIKVEDTAAGDYLRWAAPHYEGPHPSASSAMFHTLNRGKRSIRLDLKRPDGVEILLTLAQSADVVVESFRPGVLDRLGCGYDVMGERNPRLIYCAITGYGHDSPYAQRPGHDLSYLARTGLLGLTGDEDGPPIQLPTQLADIGGGALTAVIGILIALHERQHSGRGQFIDTSMADGALSWLSLIAATYFATGQVPRRGRIDLGGAYLCYRPYACADGWITLAALEAKFWRNFCNAIGRADLIPHQFDPPGSPAHRELQELFAAQPRSHWEHIGATHDCCLDPILNLDEALGSELVRARSTVTTAHQPGAAKALPVIRTPIRLDRTPANTDRSPAPALGEHTDQVLTEAGYGTQQIDDFHRSGAVAGLGADARGSYLA